MEYTTRELIDRTRQRLMSDYENSFVAQHARKMELGIELFDEAQFIENEMLNKVVNSVSQEIGSNENLDSTGWTSLKGTLVLAIRQALWATMMDDGTRLQQELKVIFKVLWKLEVKPATVELIMERLRDELSAKLTPTHFALLDKWTRLVHLSMVAACGFGSNKNHALQRSLTDLFNAHSDWEKNDPTLRRRLASAAENLMMLSVRGLLPGGDKDLAQYLYKISVKIEKDTIFGLALIELIPNIVTDILDHVPTRFILKSSNLLKQSVMFLEAAHDYHDKKESLLATIKNRSSEKFGSFFSENEGKIDLLNTMTNEFLNAHINLLAPSGIDAYHEKMLNLDQEVYQLKAPFELVQTWLECMIEQAESNLLPKAFGSYSATMEKSKNYLIVSADFALNRIEILETIADTLANENAKYFGSAAHYKGYVVRDHVTLLDTIAWSLMPETDILTSGRIAIFGDILIADKFPKEVMLRSFELLQNAISQQFTDQVSALMSGPLEDTIKYLKVCVDLVLKEGKILDQASASVTDKFESSIESFRGGKGKVKTDARTLLRTAVASIIPGGQQDLFRGLNILNEAISDLKFNPEMMNEHFSALVSAVKEHLEPENGEWAVPILQSCQEYVRISSALQSTTGEIISQSTQLVFERFPEVEHEHLSIRRHLGHDYTLLLRFGLLSKVPGGQKIMAKNLSMFTDVIMTSGLSKPYVSFAFNTFKDVLKQKVGEEVYGFMNPFLEQACQAIITATEVSNNKAMTIQLAVASVASDGNLSDSTSKALNNALNQVLHYAPLTSFEGGKSLFAQKVRALSCELSRSSISPSVVWEAFGTLNEQLDLKVSEQSMTFMRDHLETAREYLCLACTIGKSESDILRSAVTKAMAANSSGGITEHSLLRDSRVLLKSSMFATLPGGKSEHQANLYSIGAVYKYHRNGSQSVLTASMQNLTSNFNDYVKVGSTKRLIHEIEESAKYCLA